MDISDTETGSLDEATWDAGEATEHSDGRGHRQTSRKKKPIYIFARVISVIEPSSAVETDFRTRLLLLRYVIDVGDEKFKEVC